MVSGNQAFDEGGAVRNEGVLEVFDSRFEGNHGRYGGAIFNHGTLAIHRSQLMDNSATTAWPFIDVKGGAIFNKQGSVSLVDSTLARNAFGPAPVGDWTHHGGAIYSDGGTVDIRGSTLFENSARNAGGAIYQTGEGELAIANSTLSGNVAISVGGGIQAYEGGGDSL